MITRIYKRNGQVAEFDISKITNAIFAAAKAVGGSNRSIAIDLSGQVKKKLDELYDDSNMIPSVDDVQNVVEKILIENGHAKTAKAFILYRKNHDESRDATKIVFEAERVVDNYLNLETWETKENANGGFSFTGLTQHATGKIITHYVLTKVYPPEISAAHRDGDFHIHDLTLGIIPYCAGWSLKDLLWEGFNGVLGKLDSAPANHFDVALMQMINFLGTMQNEWAGAQAFSSFDTYLAPFVRHDNLSYKQVKQAVQTFIYNCNVASRWGGQTPFTNITLDWTVPEDMKDQPVIIGGSIRDSMYGDYQKEMDMINKAFLEVMIKGDAGGKMFSFPIPTYNITKDFNWDSENADLLFDMTAKFGIPNFQNFVNSSLKPSDVRSMCCRLQLDLRELRAHTGGLFGAGEKTGSIGVVTLNLPRLGFVSNSERELIGRLEYLMDLAKDSLEIKRKLCQHNIDNGLLPYTKRYLGSLNMHFNTIGIIGMNEMVFNLIGEDISSENGKALSLRILQFMRDKLTDYQEMTGHVYNLEATPAESTAYRLARLDKQRYPGIFTQGLIDPFYTNSSHLPVDFTNDLFVALQHQNDLQKQYNGGTMFHAFIGESAPDKNAVKELVRKISSEYEIPNFTITPTFSMCQQHGRFPGRLHNCPECNGPMDIYSRIVGYYRPIRLWNPGKLEEFDNRVEYSELHLSKTEIKES